jgi:hypothetical protein
VLIENTCCICILSLSRKYNLILCWSGSSRLLSPALKGRSQVISYHLQALGIFIYGTIGYICYHGKEPGLIWRKTGKTDAWSLSLFMLNTCLSLSWTDQSVWAQSRVAQLRPKASLFECTSEGSHCKLLVYKGRYLEVLIVLVAWYPWECSANWARDFWVLPKVIYGCLGTGLPGEC